MPDLPEGITEENRPDWMTDEYLRHQEWAAEQRELIDGIRDEIIEGVCRRDGVGPVRWGTSVSNDGSHTVNFTLEIEGEPFEEESPPYFWRYREENPHGDDLDMLLLPIEGDGILEEDGETTIVWWGENDG